MSGEWRPFGIWFSMWIQKTVPVETRCPGCTEFDVRSVSQAKWCFHFKLQFHKLHHLSTLRYSSADEGIFTVSVPPPLMQASTNSESCHQPWNDLNVTECGWIWRSETGSDLFHSVFSNMLYAVYPHSFHVPFDVLFCSRIVI